MYKFGIVAIGYNRTESLVRLLKSLEMADYIDEVTLIISIDKSDKNEVRTCAEQFSWTHGVKIVRCMSERLGLRNHILKCGSYLEEYSLDAIAVFEDDIVASKVFYSYMVQVYEKYEKDERIAGVSLYSPRINNNVNQFFEPLYSEYDVYFMQYAQSWGQIWFRKQWSDFRKWYETNQMWPPNCKDRMPDYVLNWPESSWLKYHIAYCIDSDRYFVYPYYSLTTNFHDAGEHSSRKTSFHQVQMRSYDKKMKLPDFGSNAVMYDSFFENVGIETTLVKNKKVLIDLYGTKKICDGYDYIVTSKNLSCNSVLEYGMYLRPIEENIIKNISGDSFRLYDSSLYSIKEMRESKKSDIYEELRYNYKTEMAWSEIFHVIKYKLAKIVARLFSKSV